MDELNKKGEGAWDRDGGGYRIFFLLNRNLIRFGQSSVNKQKL